MQKVHKVKESILSTTTTAPPKIDDENLAKVVQEYSDNIHPVSPMEFEQISDLMDCFTAEIIIKAIGQAVDAGKRSLGYIKGILRSWQENGICWWQPGRAFRERNTE